MAEEESGFTFVDKRRTQVEAAPEAAPEPEAAVPEVRAEAPPEAVKVEDSDLLEDADAQGTPSTYELIGYCINLLASQAWQNLGLLADPQTGEAKPNLAEAKVAIDAVSGLASHFETAPEATVPAAMRRELRTLLNDLRLNYVSRRGPDVGSSA